MPTQKQLRQEIQMIRLINDSVRANQGRPITIRTRDMSLKGVERAEFANARQSDGFEGVPDICLFLRTRTGTNVLNISMKGLNAVTLGGGGMLGIKKLLPIMASRFLWGAYHNHLDNGLKKGDRVPDTYALLDLEDRIKLMVGDSRVGGTTHLLFIGQMDIQDAAIFHNRSLFLPGNFHSPRQFAIDNELFFRLHSQRGSQRFDPDLQYADRTPRIYGATPDKKSGGGKLNLVLRGSQDPKKIIEI